MGFYTPRLADAPDPLLAEHTALEEFRQSTKYRALMDGTLNSEDDPPTLCGEDIEEVDGKARLRKIPRSRTHGLEAYFERRVPELFQRLPHTTEGS